MGALGWHRDIVAAARPAAATLVAGHSGGGAHELAMSLAVIFAQSSVASALHSGGDNLSSESADVNDDDSAEAKRPAVANLTATKKAAKKEWSADGTADILVVRPDNDSIPVDAARRVIEFCSLAPVSLACRVAVILDAERMNAAAANALLKTLEEPSGNKRLILAAHCASMLPPTIVSRCSIVAAPPPDSEKAIQWLRQNGGDEKALAFCGGLPLHAAETDMQKVAAMETMLAAGKNLNIHKAAKAATDFDGWLDCLQKWVADGCRAAAGLPARYFPGREERQRALGGSLRRWLDCHAGLLQKRALASHPLARDLFMKEILDDYRAVFLD